MEWLTCIRKTVEYIEDHLTDDIDAQDIARQVYMTPYFLQKGFSIMTGYSIAEYVRNRRLHLAAADLQKTDDRIIEIAYRYGYDTPESFTKSFSRFHNASPSQIRGGKAAPKSFLPLTISIIIKGGRLMNPKVTKMFPFKVIGFQKEFSPEESYALIPKFWEETYEKYVANVYAGNHPANAYEKALMDNSIGEFGVCIDDIGNGRFRYLIAGKYCGGEVPEGMVVYEFPMGEWAIFDCVGPIPEAFQALNTKVFQEWLPGNPDYELCGNANIEWYDCANGDKSDPDYHSAIWIPVKKKD